MTTKTTPKAIAALIKREEEMKADVERWSVDAFRAERDRLESIIRSGAATYADIEAHAATRDGGRLEKDYKAMSASARAALDAFRRTNWPQFREFLRDRLQARHDREKAIAEDIEALQERHGIRVDYSDPQAAKTAQLASICKGDDVGFIRFGKAAETY